VDDDVTKKVLAANRSAGSSPHDAASEFVTLDALLSEGRHTGVLATAIENYGIQGYDRYNRFKDFDKGSDDEKAALDLLAEYVEGSYDRALYGQDVDDDSLAADYSPYKRYGWLRTKLPDFDKSGPEAPYGTVPPVTKPKGRSDEPGNLAVIGSLLLVIRGGKYGIEAHPDFKSEAALIDFLAEMIGYPGMSPRTLQTKFAIAKRVLERPPQ
jgi:hypothetical protein